MPSVANSVTYNWPQLAEIQFQPVGIRNFRQIRKSLKEKHLKGKPQNPQKPQNLQKPQKPQKPRKPQKPQKHQKPQKLKTSITFKHTHLHATHTGKPIIQCH